MPIPPTPSERYADLVSGDDMALTPLVLRLDQLLQPHPAPQQTQTTLEQLLHERLNTREQEQNAGQQAGPTLSRRDALKTAAASLAGLLTLSHTDPAIVSELTRLAGDKPMTGPRLASILQTKRGEWNTLLTQVGLERLEVQGVEGEWSVKEIIAHLTWYENKIVEGAQRVFGTGVFTRNTTGLSALPMDERNEHIAAESRLRLVSEVLAEADQVFAQLMTFISMCPEDILNDPLRVGLPDDEIPPWMRVANNSYGHYREHEEAIRVWLARQQDR